MTYKYLKDTSIADTAFVAEGKTLNEMFESAGLAVTNTMVKSLKSVKPRKKVVVKLRAKDLERLLFDFLHEIVFLKDRDQLLFSKITVKVNEKNCTLAASLSGEKLDMKKHELIVDVKAVTWHLFELKNDNKKWICHIVLDI